MNYRFALCMGILLFFCVVATTQAVPAFPGAEGFGAQAVGGRGGQVLFVTNLNDSGLGACAQQLRRTVPGRLSFVSRVLSL